MAPPPQEFVDDVIAENLLRLPPDEPQSLFRAALVCKPWLRTVSDPAFLHRYRAFHGAPPLHGLIDRDQRINRGQSFRLVPTRAVPAFPFPTPDTCCEVPLDCRHGRFLIGMLEAYLVCDPVTGVRYPLPKPEIRYAGVGNTCSAAAVLCAARGCKHLDCHGGSFCVVLMFRDRSAISATFYSSEIGAWSEAATLQGISERKLYGRGALIGDEIYFMLSGNTGIINYEWRKNCLSLINPPPLAVHNGPVTLMVMEDCSLGLACIEHSRLYLWSRRVSSDASAEWVKCRVIALDTMMPIPSYGAYAVGYAEGVDVIFIRKLVGLFMLELKSGRVRKVEANHYTSVLPYMAFYTPDRCRLAR